MTTKQWHSLRREIGRRVKQERERLKMSLSEFGGRAGISAATVKHIEDGTVSASVRQLYLIADASGCAVTELMPR